VKHQVNDPERSLATAMVHHAIKDMRHKESGHIRDYVGAVCWLGSKDSTRWFDAISIDQESSLQRLGWGIFARDILSDDEMPLSDDQRKMLIATLKHLKLWRKGKNDA
tara:strand:- start:379 stop:702 length:324 start_codon:yes stop_codon:yes gene_type:complete